MTSENVSQGRRGGWKKWVVVGGGITVAVVVVVIVVAIFLLFREISQPGEATAQYVPSDALLYASINLRPGASQLSRAGEVADLLQTDEFTDEQDELLEEIEDDTDIHPIDDVAPWLGTDVSFVILDADENKIEWVLMAQVSDRDAASDFVEDLVAYLEDELYTEFEEGEVEDAEVWVADDEDIALGLTDEYLLAADSEDTIADMVNNLDSPPSRPLAEMEDFVRVRESLPDERVMFAFVQTEDILDTVEDAIGGYGDWSVAESWIKDNTPEYMAASASFIERGLRVDLVAAQSPGSFSIESNDLLDTADVLPEDTIVLLAATGIPEAWQELRDWLEDTDPYAAEDLDESLEDFEDETDIDLEADVIESLTGGVAVALLPSDVDLESLIDDLSGGVEALLIAGPQDPDGIKRVSEELFDLLEDEGYDTDRDSIGGYDVTSIELGQFDNDFEDYEAGFLIADEWVALSTTMDSLETFHDSMTGGIRSLKSSDKFSNLSDGLPGPLDFLVYADIAGFLEMVEDGLDDDDLDDYQTDVQPFVENLSAFLMASSITDGERRLTVMVTLEEK